MIDLDPAFQAQLNLEATTLCWCWLVRRRDGQEFGFTDHDQPLEVEGWLYQPRSGFTPSDLDSKLGFAVDNSAVQGILSSQHISEADILNGLYERANVKLLRVNWMQPERHAMIWSGSFGRITKGHHGYEVELVGQSDVLARSTGRVFSSVCDARFGDSRCKLDLNQFPVGTICPRSFTACRDQFDNAENFRGFPFLIGDDAMQMGPDGYPIRDGGSRY